MDSARLGSFSNSDNECDSNDKIEINMGDINLLADTSDTNNTLSIPNQSQLAYYQKLEVKWKELIELLGQSAVKE